MKIQLKDILDYVSNSVASTTRDSANDVVTRHVLFSMGAGLVPIPLADVAAITVVQLSMIRKLCDIYQVEYSESVGKYILTALAGGTVARLGASFIKGIPFVGAIIGGLSMSIMAGASTYAVGQVFISHLEAEGNLDNFNIDAWRKAYEEQLERGKEIASRIQKKYGNPEATNGSKARATHAGPTSANSSHSANSFVTTNESPEHLVDMIFDKIEKLNELKEKGILTDEEFQNKKQSLLSQL